MLLLSVEECRLIAARTLDLSEADAELIILDYQLIAGAAELMGYMGEYYKLQLQLSYKQVEQHLQYFVKSLPYKNAPQRAECERKGVFQKETAIYANILPQVQKYANRKLYPVCYYSRSDLMVLEDLTAHYRHLQPTESYSLAHYKLVLEHLAALHAASLAWEEAEQFRIGERYKEVLKELHLSQQNEWFTTGIKGIVFLAARHAKYQTAAAQAFIKDKLYALLAKTEQLVAPVASMRNVLCHRDTWDRNIFFGFADTAASLPNSCCIVDFQLTKYCSPLLDVLFLLYIVPTASERALIYEQCLEHYFNALQAEFKRLGLAADLFSRAQFEQQCQQMRLAALTIWALTEPQTKMSSVIANKLRAEEPEKFDYFLNTERNELLLRVMKLQPGYEQKIMAPVEELLDYLMQNEELYA
ncbi:uncharacterized protein LOC108602456 [Drosophila busckii]|uniref:uncharacterized protein LOC108602456 n=1 Tax=Drosophila busckii TaxID=30019 RepID=UPI001432E290|nr:uncharacterized protein LOC108602456 [Drosophila busckii]